MKEYFKKTIPKVEKEVRKFFPKSIKNFPYKINNRDYRGAFSEPFYSLFDRGGKRMRPVLCCLMHDALGGKSKSIYEFSIISEIIHTGTLIIDDIEDKSEMRRGDRAVHKIYGESVAINCGNFLYFYPQLLIKDSNLSIQDKAYFYEMIMNGIIKVHLGQGLDNLWSGQGKYDISIDDYLQMCTYKTSALLSVALKTGGMLAGASDKLLKKLDKISEKMGMAFQIKDDILNLKPGKKWGKETGEDITEGKITHMVCNIMHDMSSMDRGVLRKIFSKHTRNKNEINKAIGIIDKYEGIEKAEKFAKELILSAKNDINNFLDDSKYKKIFIEVLDYVVERNK